MANHHRGEIDAELDGRKWRLCLTLGALAELESYFEVQCLSDLAKKLSSSGLSANDLLAVICAGLKGGGHSLEIDEIAEMRCEKGAAGYASIVAELLVATFCASSEGKASTK